MRYNDLILTESDNQQTVPLIEEVKNTKWFKESKFDLYRGSNNSNSNTSIKKINIPHNRERKPLDTNIELHNLTNTISTEKLKVNIRNGLYTSLQYSVAMDYGKVNIVIPSDNAVLFYNPYVRDFYSNVASNLRNSSQEERKQKIKDYVDNIEELLYPPMTQFKNEIICFGDVYIIDLEFAIDNGLVKTTDYSTTTSLVNQSTTLLQQAVSNSISYESMFKEVDSLFEVNNIIHSNDNVDITELVVAISSLIVKYPNKINDTLRLASWFSTVYSGDYTYNSAVTDKILPLLICDMFIFKTLLFKDYSVIVSDIERMMSVIKQYGLIDILSQQNRFKEFVKKHNIEIN